MLDHTNVARTLKIKSRSYSVLFLASQKPTQLRVATTVESSVERHTGTHFQTGHRADIDVGIQGKARMRRLGGAKFRGIELLSRRSPGYICLQ